MEKHKLVRMFLLIFACIASLNAERFVSYNMLDTSRFGDLLGDYLHAKWISYSKGFTFIYRPFPYSEDLVLHDLETLSDNQRYNYPQFWCSSNKELDAYFPENSVIWTHHFTTFTSDATFWPQVRDYSLIDWEDPNFLKEVRTLVQPKDKSQGVLSIPEGYETIGIHYRDYGLHDPLDEYKRFPTRFVPQSFYLDAFETLVSHLDKPLYIVIYTNHNDPSQVVELFNNFSKEKFPDREILVTLSSGSIGDGQGVLEDFFSMHKVDYLIGAESSYSKFAARLGVAKLCIRPQYFGSYSPDRHIIQTVAFDMNYKDEEMKTLFFDSSSLSFNEAFFQWLKSFWTAYKNGYRFEAKITEEHFEKLKASLMAPFRHKGAIEDVPLLPLDDINWDDQLFKYLAREQFAPKMGCRVSLEDIPTIAIVVGESESIRKAHKLYRSFISENGWEKHQVTLFVTNYSQREKKLAKELFALNRPKSFPLHVFDYSLDPVEGMLKSAFHDVVLTTKGSVSHYASILLGDSKLIFIE